MVAENNYSIVLVYTMVLQSEIQCGRSPQSPVESSRTFYYYYYYYYYYRSCRIVVIVTTSKCLGTVTTTSEVREVRDIHVWK